MNILGGSEPFNYNKVERRFNYRNLITNLNLLNVNIHNSFIIILPK